MVDMPCSGMGLSGAQHVGKCPRLIATSSAPFVVYEPDSTVEQEAVELGMVDEALVRKARKVPTEHEVVVHV